MDPSALIPTPDTIPAPWWLFEVLGIVTLTLHFLLMNVALGGTLIGLVRLLRRENRAGTALPQGMGFVPTALALTINLGVAPLLFAQVTWGHLIYSSSVLMAVWWILVIPALVLAYYGAYVVRYSSSQALVRVAAAVSAALLLAIAFIFVNNFSLMAQPARWVAYFDQRGGTLLNLSEPTLLPRYLHHVVAAVAVGGLFLSLRDWWRARRSGEVGPDRVLGLRIFSFATMAQVLVGIWYLLALPRDVMLEFMGRNGLATGVFTLGLILGIACIVAGLRAGLWATLGLLVATMLVMVVHRALLRAAYLGELFSPADLHMELQLSPLLVFLAVFVLGGVAVAWLIKTAASDGQEVQR